MTGSTGWMFSPAVLRLLKAEHHKAFAHDLAGRGNATTSVRACLTATDLFKNRDSVATQPVTGRDVRYLILADVPEPAILQIPVLLGMYKPDSRLHVTRDPAAFVRVLIAQLRQNEVEGIVDAYVLFEDLVVVLGDLTVRSVPFGSIAELRGLSAEERQDFRIDGGGSYLHWSSGDIHLGAAQLLQQVDPSYLADLEIARYSADTTALALKWIRESRGLRQSDFPNLSERQVRRLETGVSRLTVDAAEKIASAYEQTLQQFLEEFALRASHTKQYLEPLVDGDEREAAADRAEGPAGRGNYGG